jgi:hypothetical protein
VLPLFGLLVLRVDKVLDSSLLRVDFFDAAFQSLIAFQMNEVIPNSKGHIISGKHSVEWFRVGTIFHNNQDRTVLIYCTISDGVSLVRDLTFKLT